MNSPYKVKVSVLDLHGSLNVQHVVAPLSSSCYKRPEIHQVQSRLRDITTKPCTGRTVGSIEHVRHGNRPNLSIML